jgi:myotubularin-related protein 5/13
MRSPIFHNFLFSVDRDDPVLRPCHRISSLAIWPYFLGEELKHGPAYDLEIVGMDVEAEEEYSSAGDSVTGRDCLVAGYDAMVRTDLDIFSCHLRDLGILESELGILPHRWQFHWKNLEIPPPLPPREPPIPLVQTTPSVYERRHGRMMHKRATMDLLWRAKMGVSTGKEEYPPAGPEASFVK